MEFTLEQLSNINKEKIDLLKKAGIDTIEKLASSNVKDLAKIKGFTVMMAVNYIQYAIEFLNTREEKIIDKTEIISEDSEKKVKPKLEISQKQEKIEETKFDRISDKEELKKQTISKKRTQKKKALKKDKITPKQKDKLVIGYIEDFFTEEIVQRIRFLHFKIKKLEDILNKQGDISYDDLDLIFEYIDILNINYMSKNQNLIIKELDLTGSYYDPTDNEEINIYDMMFECARVSWVLALVYNQISKKFEKSEDWENAIISMVKCSRMYKTATYFSAAAVNQNRIGKSLETKNLEFESEQSRILAQGLAAIKEERQDNLILASKLYSGLSLLSRRLFYLGFDNDKIKKQLNAQADFDMGKACYLKAQALQKMGISESLDQQIQKRLIEDLSKKAVYYFSKSEEIWEDMLKKFKNLTEKEKGNILFNLSVVNDNIMEIDVEVLPYKVLKDIQNPEPYITVPENLAEKLPKTTSYLSNIKPVDVNVEIYRKYKLKFLDKPNPLKKKAELLSQKTALGRTIKELKSLYDNNDVDINKYTELFEKYTIKLNLIELEINKLEELHSKNKK
ncbi:MAG: helix-hairpin-helix domain-containing protein [Candidatus Thorarchaeota archaeon]